MSDFIILNFKSQSKGFEAQSEAVSLPSEMGIQTTETNIKSHLK